MSRVRKRAKPQPAGPLLSVQRTVRSGWVPGTAALRSWAAAALGDIVICPQVLRREARAQGKRERDHWMHLFIHGVLHLVGHDHIHEDEAQRMERLERRLLRRFGVGDPYRPRA